MNKNLDKLLKSKPSTETIMNSVKIKKNFWENSVKVQRDLLEKQRNENAKLKPTLELYKSEFTL